VLAVHGHAVRGRSGGGRRRRNVAWALRNDTGTGGIGCRREGNAAARKRPRVKAQRWAVHGDEEVAAAGGSGLSWRARARPGREGTVAGEARSDTWARVEAGGGARGPVPAVSGGGRAEQREKRRGQRKKKQAGVRRTCL
jgi:hypothetical protein